MKWTEEFLFSTMNIENLKSYNSTVEFKEVHMDISIVFKDAQ